MDEEQLNSIMTSEGPALYKNVFHPDLPDLAFIGFVFCESTLVEGEMQGRWLAATLAGRATLPDAEVMRERIAAQVRTKRAEQSPFMKRLITEPQFIAYMDDLAAEARVSAPWWLKWRHPFCWWLGIHNPYQYRIQGAHAADGAYDLWVARSRKRSLVRVAKRAALAVAAVVTVCCGRAVLSKSREPAAAAAAAGGR